MTKKGGAAKEGRIQGEKKAVFTRKKENKKEE